MKKLTEGVIELRPVYNSPKSFYHKAYVIEHGDGVYLKSYLNKPCGMGVAEWRTYDVVKLSTDIQVYLYSKITPKYRVGC